MNESLISVIVPIYNVEKYLDRCIESIVNQTYKNLEIILVDDGSTDNSSFICDNWAKKDARIVVIHKTNAGAPAARNTGLELAKGDFISFIDSDDYVSPYFMSETMNYMNDDIDIVECSYKMVESETCCFTKRIKSVESYNTIQAMRMHICDEKFSQIVWNKLYRASLLVDIRFTENKKIDDEFFTYLAIGNSRKLVFIDSILYAYRQHESSIMHSKYDLKHLQAIEAKELRQGYVESNYPTLALLNKTDLWYTCICCGQSFLKCCSNDEQNEAFAYIRTVMHNNRFSFIDFLKLSFKKKIIISCACFNTRFICKLRNKFNRGY